MVRVGPCPNCDADLVGAELDDAPVRCEIVDYFMMDTEDTVTGMVYERDANPILCTPAHHAAYERMHLETVRRWKEHIE